MQNKELQQVVLQWKGIKRVWESYSLALGKIKPQRSDGAP